MKKILRFLLAGLLLIVLSSEKSISSQQIEISKVWSRPVHSTVDSQGNHLSNGVVYLTMNNTGIADTLVSVETDVCKKAELHQSKMVNGMMSMHMLKNGLTLPANGVVEMKPGSYHIMLIGMRINLDPGDTFPLVLHFEKNDSITIVSEVNTP